jgi:adiponectin receptor
VYLIELGLFNGTGAAIYAARIPERWYPRRFDIYGSSHQIMHILVICAALSYTIGLVKAFDHWQNMRGYAGGACSQRWHALPTLTGRSFTSKLMPMVKVLEQLLE